MAREETETKQGREGKDSSYPAFVQQAEMYRSRDQLGKAIEACLWGLEERPDFLLGHLLLGRCYLEAGRNEEAKRELERVVSAIEQCLPAYTLLGQAYLKEGSVDQALEFLRRTVNLFPGDEGLRLKAAALERGGRARPCTQPAGSDEQPLQERIEETSAKAVMYTDTLAEIYIKQGHLNKALSIYGEILFKDPRNAEVRKKVEALKKKVSRDQERRSRKGAIASLERWLKAASLKGVERPA